ncbi:MAG: hypothetical protein J6N70_10635 [Oribacterium sp.]|nr:hypothetical protein [Oribacterium sp.]
MEENKEKVTEELTREQQLELEEKAINALIEMGVKFSVPLKINPVNPPKRILWWNKHFPNHVKVWRDKRIPKDWNVSVESLPDPELGKMKDVYVRNFVIKPLYLGTIDCLRKLYLQIEFDEELIQDQPIQETKKLFKYIPLVAKIAAVAVLNNPTVADTDSKEVKALSKFFVEHLNVSRLKRLADVISQMMNAGGFTSSIRSIREIGTTKPKDRANLVE